MKPPREPSHGLRRVIETLVLAVFVFGGLMLVGWLIRKFYRAGGF